MKGIRRNLFAVTSLLIGIALMIFSVVPYRGAESKGSITLAYELENVRFQVFRVGEITGSGVVTAERFARYNVDLNSENAAQTLAMYIERDNLRPDGEAVTDGKCEAVFTGLVKAVYLTIGEQTKVDDSVYTVMPSLISLPYTADGREYWDVRAKVKFEKTDEPETEVSCLKVWKAPEGEEKLTYPDVTVQLLKDGEVYDTVVLNSGNNWKYTWTGLEAGNSWSVTEKEFDADYTVDISKNEHIFTITNTMIEPPPSTAPTETTEPTKPTDSTRPTSPTSPTPTTPYNPPDIPQTGQMKWPIPLLSLAGISLILVGVLLIRKNRYEK